MSSRINIPHVLYAAERCCKEGKLDYDTFKFYFLCKRIGYSTPDYLEGVYEKIKHLITSVRKRFTKSRAKKIEKILSKMEAQPKQPLWKQIPLL